ncbi:MAG: hypothetical protein NZ805_13685, partial [Armatimonadetes bacterium]|nr:hypothetical protein [Armatimonadota bacterium]
LLHLAFTTFQIILALPPFKSFGSSQPCLTFHSICCRPNYQVLFKVVLGHGALAKWSKLFDLRQQMEKLLQ